MPLYALKITIVTPAGTSISGLAHAPSEDYAATEGYREAIREAAKREGFKLITLVDGQTMWDIPGDLAEKSVVGYEIIDATPQA